MIIYISDDISLNDINEKFQEFFPYLRIDFFSGPHHWNESSPENKKMDGILKVGDARKKHPHGPLEIKSWFRTGDLEQEFREKFGLHVQVYRLHANDWVQTVGTDKLTLGEQNELGKRTASEKHMADSPTERENLF